MKAISASRFASALTAIPRPGARELRFLQAHYNAPGRASTATVLADKVGYRGFGGINLVYGKLAKQIGEFIGRRKAHLSLLVEFVRPPTVTNKHWILVMRPEFAEGLRQARWL
jgi:hypothetical protein